MQIDSKKLYTVAEVSSLLRVSVATIYRRIDYLEISAVRIGRQHRIWGKELIKFLERMATNGEGE